MIILLFSDPGRAEGSHQIAVRRQGPAGPITTGAGGGDENLHRHAPVSRLVRYIGQTGENIHWHALVSLQDVQTLQ